MIYRSIWKALPGKLPVKAFQAVVIAAVVVAGLFSVVFPWIELSCFAPPTVEG